MSTRVEIIPVLSDNYIPVLIDDQKQCYVVDPAEAAPVEEFLKQNKLQLRGILNTHHHWDHVGGIAELVETHQCPVVGPTYDKHRTSPIHSVVSDGDTTEVLGHTAFVKYVPGHTLGHIAYYIKDIEVLFIGDTLFALGCGRLFEGTPEQMHQSLQWVKSLPGDTKVYCAHEYTLDNGKFAMNYEPNNLRLIERYKSIVAQREKNLATVPTTIGLELETNPFLRCDSMEITQNLGLSESTPEVEVFAALRQAKDNF